MWCVMTRFGSVLAILGVVVFLIGLQSRDPVIPTDAAGFQTIQQMVDSAAPGSTVTVPAGIYREMVTINKSLTLKADPGTEIRGSDDWSHDTWTSANGQWVSSLTVPEFSKSGGECAQGHDCRVKEQVFLDGVLLAFVPEHPGTGQFSLTSSRQVVLGDNPEYRTVEVTTREYWLLGTSDDVTVDGFIMRHAANSAQQGAISNFYYPWWTAFNNWTIQNNVLAYAHGANVSLAGGHDLKLLNNDIGFAGQLGIHGSESSNVVVRGNRVHHNNINDYSPGWEAGGMKMAAQKDVLVANNEFHHNYGPGIWFDVDSSQVTISENQVHNNEHRGIQYEISSHATIRGNIVWENGYAFSNWGWGAGILVQNSSHVDVHGNFVAWNADGISIISQDRKVDRWNRMENIKVHENTILSVATEPYFTYALAWLEDWSGTLGHPDSNNRGERNSYYHANPQDALHVFVWIDDERFVHGDLSGFGATPGESNPEYLDASAMQELSAHFNVPPVPDFLAALQLTLNPIFHSFWERSGGVSVFGYPISEEFSSAVTDTGQVHMVQYLERQRFEHHPENAGTVYEVLIGRLGVEHAERRGLLSTEAFQAQNVNPDSQACRYFEETNQHVCDHFKAYWEAFGLDLGDAGVSYRESLGLFGFPISTAFQDPHTGLLTQYFERAVFEHHPENFGAPHEVLLVRLGAQELSDLGW